MRIEPGSAGHDAWFRACVHEALADTTAPVPHAEVEAHFAQRRERTLRRLEEAGMTDPMRRLHRD